MRLILLLCLLLTFGGASLFYAQHVKNRPKLAASPAPKIVASTSALSTSVPSPLESATPEIVRSAPEPLRHVAPAGTLTKEQLLGAINQDAKESSLEKLLGPPNYRKSTSWSSFSVWTDKLDTGGDSPAMVTAEIAKYNGIPLVVSIYDPASGSSTFLPWHDKVARAYNDALNAATYEAALARQIAENNAAVAAYNAGFQQTPRDTNPISTSARRSSPPLVLHYAGSTQPGAYDGDQRVATGTARSTMIGTGRTEAEARANIECRLGYTGYSNIKIKEESFHKGQYEYTCTVDYDHETR